MIRLKNKRKLVEETKETEATCIRATEEKHGSDSNEPRTTNNSVEEIEIASVYEISCMMLAE
jgi:hypothetical protein